MRIVTPTRMERFSWLVCGILMLIATAVFWSDRNTAEQVALLWLLALSGVKMTVLGTVGRYPMPRWRWTEWLVADRF